MSSRSGNRVAVQQDMDEEAAAIRRRIAEARGVQQRLTQMQARIRRQHDQLEDALRGFIEEARPYADEFSGRLTTFRDPRRGPSRA